LEAPGSLGGIFLSKSAPCRLSSDAPPNKQPAACEIRPSTALEAQPSHRPNSGVPDRLDEAKAAFRAAGQPSNKTCKP
jgi:hypothetical protein